MLKAIPTLLVACLCAAPAFAEPIVGVQIAAAHDDDNLRNLSLSVWYPAQEGGSPEDVGGNAVFIGQPAYRDAVMAPGPYPLVLLSHGGLRSAPDSGAWLSGRLAEKGFIVVEVNGPRPNSAKAAVNEIWQRPLDVSRALDWLLRDPSWSSAIDQSRIATVGYALGGTAALSLAGGMFDADAFAMACAADADGPDCAWYAAQGVSLATIDQERLEQPYRDPRIGTAIAINPEYADVFFAPSLKAQGSQPRVIWLGARDHGQADTIGLPHTMVEIATGYDAFPLCTPKGRFILAEDGGDAALCDSDPTARAHIHDEIAERLVAAFDPNSVSD
ncbi:alpha/beta hydrolase family protein [Paracoccus homiensis]|uniref:Dienelactone hydrolase n=1 Tax=Paracoccus homiensis TaxID=364199 RepID=A0A1I0IMT9_9RHOB|nr:hypothetical protein [Paracoccus homiensis]SET98344.1 hypothetical protein SAMN04489858_11760 [Paracoccus homiensis]